MNQTCSLFIGGLLPAELSLSLNKVFWRLQCFIQLLYAFILEPAAGCSGTGPVCSEGFWYFGFSLEEMCPNRVTYPSLLIKTVMCIILGSGSLKKSSPFLMCTSPYLIYMINYWVERGWSWTTWFSCWPEAVINVCLSDSGRTAIWVSRRLCFVLVPGWLLRALAFLRICKYRELFCTGKMFRKFFLLDMIGKLIILLSCLDY